MARRTATPGAKVQHSLVDSKWLFQGDGLRSLDRWKERSNGDSGNRKPINMRQFAKLVALATLRAYKWAISPMFLPSCRYVPTCSEYAMEAIECFGVLRGAVMACARLLRCHPFARGGYDPVVKPAAECRRPITSQHTHAISRNA